MVQVLKATVLAVGLLWIGACAVDVSDANKGTPFSNSGTPSATGGNISSAVVSTGTEAGAPCPANNVTQPCSCELNGRIVAGRQVCIAASWGKCDCAVELVTLTDGGVTVTGPVSNKSSSTFDWEETEPSTTVPGGGGTCKAGHYVGVFSGFYNSPRMSQDTQNTMSPVGIPVLGTVEFDLHQLGNGEYFELRDGAMEGYALVVFPFKGDLVGTINCSGAEPEIEVYLKNGSYFAIDFEYYFDGKAVAVYDKKESLFAKGEWAVTEPDEPVVRDANGVGDLTNVNYAPLPELIPGEPPFLDMFIEGGTGSWDAAWTGPETGVGTTP